MISFVSTNLREGLGFFFSLFGGVNTSENKKKECDKEHWVSPYIKSVYNEFEWFYLLKTIILILNLLH